MTPSITAVRMTGSAHRAELPLLVLGPANGTSAMALWSACASDLIDAFDVVAWDLPGHGHNRWVPEEPITLTELASGVLGVVDDILVQREQAGGPFFYAGDSVGGAVGLQLLLDAPGRVASVVVLGARPLEKGEARGLGVLDVPVLELVGAAYLNPIEASDELAKLLRQHFLGVADPGRASARATDFAHDLATFVRGAVANGASAEEVRRALLEAADQYEARPGIAGR